MENIFHLQGQEQVHCTGKRKTLKGCIAAILMWSFKNQQTVDKDIIKAAGVSASKVTLGIPGMARAKKIITDYYMGK